MYKSKLQELCQQKQWALPRYTSMKTGPDHTPCFKSSVSLNGESFNSSTPCKSRKDSQNDAAKSAFLHFTSSAYSLAVAANPNPVQEVDLGIYKNLLQELTQKEAWSSPEYKTIKCGVSHKPTYFSTVEVEDDLFYGIGAKSKKEAEINAAKAAYTNLTQRLQVSKSVGTEKRVEEMQEGGDELAIFIDSIENSASCSKCVAVSVEEGFQGEPLKSMSSSDLITAVENEEHAEENEVQEVKTGEKQGSMSCESTYVDISDLSISDSTTEKEAGSRSYLLNNRFRVYPFYPDIAFPQGIIVLPISEDKWVAVSLEFPNERND